MNPACSYMVLFFAIINRNHATGLAPGKFHFPAPALPKHERMHLPDSASAHRTGLVQDIHPYRHSPEHQHDDYGINRTDSLYRLVHPRPVHAQGMERRGECMNQMDT